ncbi:hypothetical protein [Brachybacterium massiliense]|uniref:hypothetical protein n=1 Tax=Brachybacterium massiliense TaxID=1755098 RepID=UPI000B3BC45F|nr:hypothetical protein [Brachybacterium massiliense]
MKLYRPVLIESAEQAEALPDGAVLVREDHFVFQKHAGQFVSADPHDLPTEAAWEVVGWTALVPIEAEEERRTLDLPEMLGGARNAPVTRLVTPWEEAQ